MEPGLAMHRGLNHQASYFRLAQVERTHSGVIKKPPAMATEQLRPKMRRAGGKRGSTAGFHAAGRSRIAGDLRLQMGKAAFVHFR